MDIPSQILILMRMYTSQHSDPCQHVNIIQGVMLLHHVIPAGLDTGCCYGFKLTACILPPPPKKLLSRVLAHLKPIKVATALPSTKAVGTSGGTVTSPKNGSPGATLESLGAILVAVESKHTYEDVVRY